MDKELREELREMIMELSMEEERELLSFIKTIKAERKEGITSHG